MRRSSYYVTTAAVLGVLRNPRTVIHYAQYAWQSVNQ